MAHNVSDEEKQLLLDIAAGDRHAFTLLFKKYNHYVYSAGRRLTHSDYWAEELVQDIFFKIWQKREKLDEVENFGAYLNRIVRNHSFNILRQLAQDAKSMDRIENKEIAHTTDEMVDLKEASVILEQALGLLTPQQRIAYELCHVQGLKYQEAALQMKISYETVHSHMKEAIKKIRSHFRARGIVYTLLFAILFA
uniref:RNA polymerase sigma factor n=1 Tax=Pedobacter schmidteae TaxID=2201271 RepID=UPI000EACE57C|nr:sigma-70 family RNA polymerase sigma factor [Pedobacter schmidteae]